MKLYFRILVTKCNPTAQADLAATQNLCWLPGLDHLLSPAYDVTWLVIIQHQTSSGQTSHEGTRECGRPAMSMQQSVPNPVMK